MTAKMLLEQYMAERHALGFVSKTDEGCIRRFLRDYKEPEDGKIVFSKEYVLEHIGTGLNQKANTVLRDVSAINGFLNFVIRKGFTAYKIPPKSMPKEVRNFRAYIFTDTEIEKMLDSADHFPVCTQNPVKKYQIPVMFRMLFNCGLRTSELLNLRVCDVDFTEKVLAIRDTKFHKSRLVPFTDAVAIPLANYLELFPPASNEAILFASCCSRSKGEQYGASWIHTQFRTLLRMSEIPYGGPDLRVIAIQADVERIRYRKPPPALVGYLTKEELSIFLAQPNCKKRTGFRNMVFLVLMYDTAARCQEMLDLRIQDLVLHRTSPCVYFTGKGNKTRVVPILPKTAEHLRSYLKKFHPAENRKRDDYVFYAYGGPQRPMSPDTVAAFVKKYGESARHVCTSIPERVHPHMLRHTRAMHLYQDGVPLAMVSEFLGHAQIETTKIYAHADTEMKRKAIQQAANKLNDTIPDALWNTDDEEMMLKLRGKQQYK